MFKFNPLSISNDVKDLYKNFILSSFPLKNPKLKNKLENAIDNENLLWNGPYISLASKYKKGQNSKDFLQRNNFDEIITKEIQIDKLFLHQEEAIQSILENESTIVSTGTGSGKTESFILPILDYCIKNRQKGLKAIIVYPMNALANDQMLRLRTLLYKINSKLPEPITISKYIGQTPRDESEKELQNFPLQKCQIEKSIFGSVNFPNCPDNCDQIKLKADLKDNDVRLICKNNYHYENNFEILTRKDIRKNPPDILITNYVQLEYLLLRREDSPIFKSPHMKFLVFDELHYYSGARGAEVALLIRRLKSRIRKYSNEKIISIGTSATISSGIKAREETANFASNIFGEQISPKNVIIGEMESFNVEGGIIPNKIPEIPLYSYLELLSMSKDDFKEFCGYFSDSVQNMPDGEERLVYIGKILYKNEIFKKIVDSISSFPKSEEEILEGDIETALNNIKNPTSNNLENIIWKYLYIGSMAYDPIQYERGEKEPLIRPQVHMFFKTLGERWPFGNAFACVKCNELYTKPIEKCTICNSVVEEIGICRFCGEVFYKSKFEKNPLDNSRNARAFIGIDTTIDNLKVDYNEEGHEIWQLFKDPDTKGFIKQKKCTSCGSLVSQESNKCPFCDNSDLIEVFYKHIHNCPFCKRSYGPKLSAISSIYMSPNITSRLVFDINFTLLPKEKRKMIVFSDSRQDASYMAGTIEDDHLDHMIRQIITQNVRKSKFLSYNDLNEIVFNKLNEMYPKLHEKYIEEKLLMEISTVIGRKRAVESLGLVSIDYINLKSLNLTEDLTELEIDQKIFNIYLKFILNRIRHQGALEGLHNKRFRNGPKGFVCENKMKKSWVLENIIPKATYPNTFSYYTKKVFPGKDPKKILEKSFEILVKYNYLKEMNIGIYDKYKEKGYVINRDKLEFNIPEEVYECNLCGRLFTSAPILKCPSFRCQGDLIKKDAEDYYASGEKFHTNFYKDREPVRLKVKEDTGYIPVEQRQRDELAFRSGDIDLLVSTPTLELGIDIGDLVCIGLMKAPPSPANYTQRVGRAGRDTKVSMSNAFMFQNPIDLYYFDFPQEIINGTVLAPILNLNNHYIVNRHVSSLILEELLVTPDEAPEYHFKPFLMKKFVENNFAEKIINDVYSNADILINTIKKTFSDLTIVDNIDSNEIIKNFQKSFKKSLKAYNTEFDLLKEILNLIRSKQDDIRMEGSVDAKRKLYYLRRREANIDNRFVDLNRKEFFSHLSYSDVIPRYAFSGSSVKLISYEGKDYGDRQMPTALYELAPGMPLYLGGKKNRVIGLPFDHDPEMMTTTRFYVCQNCGIYAKESQSFEKCPECGSINSAAKIDECHKLTAVVIEEEGSAKEEGREATYVDTSVYLLQSINEEIPNELNLSKDTEIGKVRLLGKRSILTIANGINDLNNRSLKTFNLCGTCGYYLGGDFSSVDKEKDKNHPDILGKGFHKPKSSEILNDIRLYHRFDTSVLLISFPNDDEIFLTTIKNALLNSAQRIVGAEDGEIEGIIKDNNLILYDNIEGGAGYVNTIYDKFSEILNETRNLVLNCNCEIGCLKCLYSYRRRRDIQNIDKRKIISFIKDLQCTHIKQKLNEKSKPILNSNISGTSAFKSISKEFKLSGESKCILSDAGNLDGAIELRDSILSAKESITIVSLYVSDFTIQWEDNKSFSWCDILISSKMNGVKDLKIIVRPPRAPWEEYALKRLRDRGIEILTFDGFDVPGGIAHSKIVLIDDKTPQGHVILQSANLSPEVSKNTDFYIFLTKKQNNESFPIIKNWLENLSKRCNKLNI